ncbi:MAG: polyhydroxyalkanoate depolymerase [Salinisphaeraceae bacterium]
MRYALFDLQRECLKPATAVLSMAEHAARSRAYPLSRTPVGRLQAATFESTRRLLQSYPKQPWAYDDVEVDGERHTVRETVVARKPFANLLRFRRDGLPDDAPKVLFVAAVSGHHATLSRETYEAFLPDHDVYVTDWLDAKHVPASEGRFGLEEYTDYLIEFLEDLGPETHLFAICQAAVPAMVATAAMCRDRNPCRPRSLLMMAGPIDIRVNPNDMLKKCEQVNMPLLKASLIHRVPARFAGAGRRVYPGALQLTGFMSMNPKLHLTKHWEFFRNVASGNEAAAAKHREFYDEYFSLLDTTEEFYIETLERVFIDQHLPKGCMQYRGRTVTGESIRDVPIMTMEGALDDMVAIGQCSAALDLCPNLPDAHKHAYVQQGVGHYGIFKGQLYREETAPEAKAFIGRHKTPRKKTN